MTTAVGDTLIRVRSLFDSSQRIQRRVDYEVEGDRIDSAESEEKRNVILIVSH